MTKPFKQTSLKIVIKGDRVFLHNHHNIGLKLREDSYVDKRHLIHQIKQMIDWDFDEINDTPEQRKRIRTHKKFLETYRKGK